MKTYPELMELERCLDERRTPSAQLLQRIDADPRLRRRARALRLVDARLREELGEAALERPHARASRSLPALGPRPTHREVPVRRWAALAAAAALVAWLAIPKASVIEPAPVVGSVQPAPLTQFLHWSSPLEPAPEAALVEEGRKLAADTRHVARSLWGRLPITAWLTRGDSAGG